MIKKSARSACTLSEVLTFYYFYHKNYPSLVWHHHHKVSVGFYLVTLAQPRRRLMTNQIQITLQREGWEKDKTIPLILEYSLLNYVTHTCTKKNGAEIILRAWPSTTRVIATCWAGACGAKASVIEPSSTADEAPALTVPSTSALELKRWPQVMNMCWPSTRTRAKSRSGRRKPVSNAKLPDQSTSTRHPPTKSHPALWAAFYKPLISEQTCSQTV